jgi:putative Mg2+ transporter-C (MgtC) family protein
MVSDQEVVFRLLLSVLFSGLIGLEREVYGRAAGLRTHILVCVGATLIMLTAIHLYEQFRGLVEVDPGRVAAQVVSGIGFLGAGTIIQFRGSVRGLTTAASLWAAAGMGLAIGSGFYMGAIATTAIVLAVLYILSRVERRVVGSKREGVPEE